LGELYPKWRYDGQAMKMAKQTANSATNPTNKGQELQKHSINSLDLEGGSV
jgi:hypothetical protein